MGKKERINSYLSTLSDKEIIIIGNKFDNHTLFLGFESMTKDWEDFLSTRVPNVVQVARGVYFGDLDWGDEYIGWDSECDHFISTNEKGYANIIRKHDLAEQILEYPNIITELPNHIYKALKNILDENESDRAYVKDYVRHEHQKNIIASKKTVPKTNSKRRSVKKK